MEHGPVMRPVDEGPPGVLHVLSIGVGQYRSIGSLKWSKDDAVAITERLRREGLPLYEEVRARPPLVDDQATTARIRDELRALRKAVRPGWIDTVAVFLAGHGDSEGGSYYFAPHDVERKNLPGTAISGQELRAALQGLEARAVFLFVDTCRSGGLGRANAQLARDVGQGVFVIASSGADQLAFEDTSLGHGLFTQALLNTLGNPAYAPDGYLRFGALVDGVVQEVRALIRNKPGLDPADQTPIVPLVSGQSRLPVAQVPK